VGLLGKLFGKKPAKPPVWARAAFRDDIASFEAFVDTVATVRDERDYTFSDDDIRTGSAMFDVDGKTVEWIFEGVAADCATSAVTGWKTLVEQSDPLRGAPEPEPAPMKSGEPLSRKMQILAHLLLDEIDKADAIAVEGIATNDHAEDMHFQRAMIALMRGDELLADAELALIATPQALTSRATLAGHRRDPIARELAAQALAQLPGDAIAIRCAISAHMFTGDPEGAKALLAEHGHYLDSELRVALASAIADPTSVEIVRTHTFPEHAKVALQSIIPMIEQGMFAAAEKPLRRARTWDPGNLAITAELGVVLAQQKKFAEAIAVYDETIARGGTAQLLRFNRGNCYLNLGKLDEAAADYRACLEIKPDWAGPRQNLAALEKARRS